MNEAERFLEEKLRRADTPARQPAAAVEPSDGGRCESTDWAPGNPPPTAPTPEASGKVWGVVMGVFAALATMFWMAVFKSGCR